MKEVNIKINADTKSASKSMGDLNKEVKKTITTFGDLEEEQDRLLQQLKETEVGTEEFRRLSKELNNVKSQVKDIELGFEGLDMEQRFTAYTDAVGGLAGGFAAVEGAIAIAGVESEEFEQTLLKVNGAMALAMGIKDISTMIAALKKLNIGTKVYAATQKVLNFVMNQNPIGKIILALTALGALITTIIGYMKGFANMFSVITDAIGLTDSKAEQHARNQKLRAEAEKRLHEERLRRIKKEVAALTKRYDREIELAEAAGESTERIERRKITDLLAKQTEIVKAQTQRVKTTTGMDRVNAKRRLKEEVDVLNQLLHESKVFDIRIAKAKEDALKEQEKQNKESYKRRLADHKKFMDELDKQLKQLEPAQARILENTDLILQKIEISTEAANASMSSLLNIMMSEAPSAFEQLSAWAATAIQDTVAVMEGATRGIQNTSNLANAIFDAQTAAAQGNAEKQEAIERKKFEFNKKIQIAQATMQGLTGIQNVWTAQSTIPQPFDAVYKGLQSAFITATTAATIAGIRNSSFGGGAPNIGGGGRAALGSVTSNITGAGQTPNTIVRPDGENMPQRVYVTETDISDTQNRVRVLEQESTIG